MRNLNGIRLHHYKKSKDLATVELPLPKTVTIPMLQHMGVGCTPVVQVGDAVKVGQLIGDSEEAFSVPVHSSVAGTVTAIQDYVASSGKTEKQVVIEVAEIQETINPKPHPVSDQKSLVEAARLSGLSGLGGAGFPTHVKLNYKDIDKVDTLVINGAECEPHITSDYREMLEAPDDIIGGVKEVMRCLNIANAYIGIEDNKPDAIKLLREKIDVDNIHIVSLKSVYPQGAEKVMIYHSTGRVIEEGEIPADKGVIVLNISTVSNLYRFIKTGMPLTHKRLTIDGNYVDKPLNVRVPIGTSINYVLDFAGVDKNKADKILMGGPMMGIAIYDVETPVIKNNNAILVLQEKSRKYKASRTVSTLSPAATDGTDNPEDAAKGPASTVVGKELVPPTTACIRCGKCVYVCPVNLMPAALEKAYDKKNVEALKNGKVNLCINCGCCSYICPAHRNLAQKNQLAKNMLKKMKK